MKTSADIALDPEFASVMQQLSVEAQEAQSVVDGENGKVGSQLNELLGEFRALNRRMDKLEAKLAETKPAAGPNEELSRYFEKMDEQMSALRETDSVNQRLFDSLHDELIKYRDNFLHESLQKPFIRDLVVLFDDLSTVASQVSTAADQKGGVIAQWRDNIDNGIHALVEILHRLEVTEIEPKEKVDRACHKVVSYEPADFPEDDGRIVMRLKRGFMWRDRVLRAEEVVAKRFS
ncbi:MAG: nucleotide exchange factor GrpE [Verrucomicrobiota bacterium]|nr:nucleotide exchange factor GrpE [Verrucomicrobiota bacterium]